MKFSPHSSLLTPYCFLVFALACLMAVPAGGAEVIDRAGRRVQVPASPARVVALAPSIVEIVYSLGRQDILKGVTQYSDYPEAAKALPRVGSYVQPDLERILALQPDLCIGIRDGNPKHVVERIEAAGIPVYVIDPRNLNEIIATIEQLGVLLHAGERAGELGRDMQQRIDRVAKKVAVAGRRPSVFFQIDAAPIVSAGRNTFVHELITLAGGINVAAGMDGYPHFSWEEILTQQPEIVVITSMAGGQSPAMLKATWHRWPQVPAVRDQRLYVVAADLFDRPTARLVVGLEVMAAIIHPELFDSPAGEKNGPGRGGK